MSQVGVGHRAVADDPGYWDVVVRSAAERAVIHPGLVRIRVSMSSSSLSLQFPSVNPVIYQTKATALCVTVPA
jgi:hypothetical protein